MKIFPIETEYYYYEHLLDSSENRALINDFCVARQSGKGLENYLKNLAETEETENSARTYLVKNKITKEIAAFFTLKAGLFTVKIDEERFNNISAIELSNFAVNSNYRNKHPEVNAIGKDVFSDFVLPLVTYLQDFFGAQALYIFALPEDSLIEHYKSLGFYRLERDEEEFVHVHVKPKYDDSCIFMYQIL